LLGPTISHDVPLLEQVISTPLTKLLGISHPIVLAPLLRSAGGLLSGHVARAGGLGLIGVGSDSILGPEWVTEQHKIAMEVLNEKQNKTTGALGFGFIGNFMKEKNKDSSFLKALQLHPDIIWISFVDSLKPYLPDVHSAGAKLITMVHTVADAQKFAQEGADIIVVQGNDAGGHGMQYLSASVISLVPEVHDLLNGKIPVLGAGGISDGRGLAAVLALGASGAVMGTRFYASSEAQTSEKIRKNLISAKDGGNSTVASGAFDSFYPLPWDVRYTGRAIRENEIVKRYHHLCVSGKKHYKPTKQELEEYQKLQETDPITWSGTGIGLVHSIESASKIIYNTIKEAETCLKHPKNFTFSN